MDPQVRPYRSVVSDRRRDAMVSILALVLAGCGARPASPRAEAAPPAAGSATEAAPRPAPRHACDPMSSSRPVPAPAGSEAAPVCGNGVLDRLPGECFERCVGGCDGPVVCSIDCPTATESCDGDAFTALATCAGMGYAGGTSACTATCEPSLAGCTETVPTPGLRQRSLRVAGDTAHLVSTPAATVLFALDTRRRALTGVVLDATLRNRRRLPRMRIEPVQTGGLGERLAFVNRDDRFGTVSVAGAVTWLGTLAATSSVRHILPDLVHPGRGVVASVDGPTPSLALIEDPAAPVGDPIRWFGLDDTRVVVIDGAHPIAAAAGTGGKRLVVVRRGARATGFALADGLLVALPAAPFALTFSDSRQEVDDSITWSGGSQRVTYKRKVWIHDQPPAGLSYQAVAYADVVTAFGGTLFARKEASSPRVALYWLPMANPLVPTLSAQ